MGFDISNHPIDVALIKQRIIPCIRGHGQLDDLVARAARLNCIRHRANCWGMGVLKLSWDISDRQRQLGLKRKVRLSAVRPPGIMGRLLGRAELTEVEASQETGLPGFDSDMCVWGRPYFIVADTVEEALEGLDTYLGLADAAPETVDAVARRMIAKLDSRSDLLPPGYDESVLRILSDNYPLADRVKPAQEGETPDEAETARRIAADMDLARKVFAGRDSGEVIEVEDREPELAADLALALPHQIINIAAQTLPGWMGRGRVWPTSLFRKIGVSVAGVFERPTSLFEDLLRDVPAMEQVLRPTIVENYCLGGYVPPEKMKAFVELLAKHRRDLILAWQQRPYDAARFDEMAADFNKILEPATYALRHGYGFIEAAEVYSGILGWMN